MFLGAFLLVWVSLHPFQSLAGAPQQTSDEGDWLNQVGFVLCFAVFALWAYMHDLRRLRALASPALLMMLAWFTVCVLTSWEPALSARRLAFTVIVISIAAIALQLPRGLRHFADLLTVSSLIVLTLCYLGVLLAPDVSVHQATDFLEPEHAGSWRGVFSHKNEAGASMAILMFVGLFVARVRNVFLGGVILGLAAFFLAMSQSKTSLFVLPLVMLLSAATTRMSSCKSAIVTILGGLILFNVFSIGSIYIGPVHDLLGMVVTDTTFTGRTDIWKFAMQELAKSPVVGYGFSAFWGTPQVVYGLREASNWATAATDAHNAYLNLAVTIGVPGLMLVLVWIAVLPAVYLFHQVKDPHNRILSIFFLRVWLFGLYASCFESMIFQQVSAVWFILVIAIFGLRQMTVARVQP